MCPSGSVLSWALAVMFSPVNWRLVMAPVSLVRVMRATGGWFWGAEGLVGWSPALLVVGATWTTWLPVQPARARPRSRLARSVAWVRIEAGSVGAYYLV